MSEDDFWAIFAWSVMAAMLAWLIVGGVPPW